MNVSKEKKAIVADMVGCLLYVIGDFLFAAIGKNQSADSIGLMVKVSPLPGSWAICSRFCRGRLIRSTTERNPPGTCWFWRLDWFSCEK